MIEGIKISIITVTFNSEAYLEETILSVLKQDYSNYEYIIVDGNSTDGTLDIIKKYKEKFHGRLSYISEPDKGIYDAMNKGIALASGKYIGMINSDDRYTVGAFSEVAKCIARSSYPDVVYSDLNTIDLQGQKVGSIIGDASKLKRGMTVNHPTCFVKKEVYQKLGNYNLKYPIVADYDFMLRVYTENGTFVKADSVLADFRIGGTSNNNYKSVQEKFAIQKKYCNIFSCIYIWLRGFVRCKILSVLK